ncbi:isochorismatase family protein [Stemphylium lycopersici]|uniref:Isochorismatase family protein n=1 Tax=Stemphylium lycopersici TaxID=183478 RepID=A0A364MTN7_STELY|nr:isochorismatase family protein [Stemphylium lycopersici]RAR02769.1 isochorismatase family protein [Stemphylium lycopersici]
MADEMQESQMSPKMLALTNLVSQNQPKFQTHQALLVVGLQNDFVLPDGRLPVNTKTGFLDRIQALIPKFRELSGNVIWVKTLYEADRIATGPDTGEGDALVVSGLIEGDESSADVGDDDLAKETASLPAPSRSSKHKQRALDLLKRVSARRKALPKEVAKASVEEDEELFLLKSEKRTPACVPDTPGAEFADFVAKQMELPADVVTRTTNYSAFQGTNLLITLRARLVTELFICGCMTNVSVLATVVDASRHGIKIYVVEDCLGFRKESRHQLALKRMEDFFDALVNSEEILEMEVPEAPQKPPMSSKDANIALREAAKTVEALMGKMSLAEEETASKPTEKSAAGRTKERSDEEFADMLVKGATVPDEEEAKPKLVKTKIRMRSGKTRKRKKKGKEEGESKEETLETIGEPGVTEHDGTANSTPPTTETATPISEKPADSQRISQVARAESVADLREKDKKPHALKNVASVPVMSNQSGDDKERTRLSDFSHRVRQPFSRAPKSESGSDTKRESVHSSKAPSTNSKQEEKETERPPVVIAQSAPTAQSEPPVELNQDSKAPSSTPATSAQDSAMGKPPKLHSLATLPFLGPGDHIAEGDSKIIHDFFPTDLFHPSDRSKPLKDLIFMQLYNEVQWQKMLHQQGEVPRLVCCQGAFGDDGSMPVYRHPADQTLPLLHFSPKVQVIRKQVEKLVGHPLNHVLIQLYRSGADFISEHSDKTLDIVKGSSIVNVSFGAQRTMRLRKKKPQPHPASEPTESSTGTGTSTRETQRVAMPHNSMFVLGLASNAKWLHGIQPDKRDPLERSAPETSNNGMRISLTFRHIGTFLDAKSRSIWGQGATSAAQRDAADVINGDDEDTKRLVTAFSRENHDAEFDWEDWYGDGFDVLHLHSTAVGGDVPLLFACSDEVENAQVAIALAECKIGFTRVEAAGMMGGGGRRVMFRDVDVVHTEIVSAEQILLYLDRYHPLDTSPSSNAVTATAYGALAMADAILAAWRSLNASSSGSDGGRAEENEEELRSLLQQLQESVETHGGPFIAGSRFSIADCAVWPLVDVLVAQWTGWNTQAFAELDKWYKGCWKRKACVKKVRERLAVPCRSVGGDA